MCEKWKNRAFPGTLIQHVTSFLLVFKEIPLKQQKNVSIKKNSCLEHKEKGGWEKYFQKKNSYEKLDRAVENFGEDTNKLMNAIKKTMTSLKHECFGKVSLKKVTKEEKEL